MKNAQFGARKPSQGMPKPKAGIRWSALKPSQQETYRKSLDTLKLLRENPGWSLTRAAHEAGTTPETVRRLAPTGIAKVGDRYRAQPSDRLARDLIFYDERGQITLSTRSSRSASEIGRYHNAVRKYLIEGDASDLSKFEGRSVVVDGKRFPYITDRRILNRLARAGELNFLEIYKHGGAL